jgi:ubiquinone/menaquinone biosynthesis C-methylase UbiE
MMQATASAEPTVRTERNHWDDAAAGWDRHTTLIRAWLHDATQQMLDAAQIAPGARVLDVAAGAGDQTLDIARRVGATGHVLANDISAAFLARTTATATRAGFTNVATHCADAQSLKLPPAQFDAAVCRMGLMFCEKPLDALREIRAALKPDARFSALVFSAPTQNPCLTTTLAIARKHAGLAPLQDDDYFAPGALMSLGKTGGINDLLQQAGFTNAEVKTLSAPFRAPSVDDYVEFLRSSASPLIELLASLDSATQERAWDEMREELRVFTHESGWRGPNELLLCSACATTRVTQSQINGTRQT